MDRDPSCIFKCRWLVTFFFSFAFYRRLVIWEGNKRWGFVWNHAFANIAIRYRCLKPACLTGDFFVLRWDKSNSLVGLGVVA
jgi:hypothetical protein